MYAYALLILASLIGYNGDICHIMIMIVVMVMVIIITTQSQLGESNVVESGMGETCFAYAADDL